MQKARSQISTTFEQAIDNKCMEYIEQLQQQNQMIKSALQTAENLIRNYQQDNQCLKRQNERLQIELAELSALNSKIMSSLAQQSQQTKMKTVDRLECRDKGPLANKLKVCCTCSKNTSSQSIMSSAAQTQESHSELAKQLQILIEKQEKYESQISNLEQKIVLLEREKSDKFDKSKLTLSIGITDHLIHYEHRKTEPKAKNLTELRALHLKLKDKEDSQKTEGRKNIGLVSRIFSEERIDSTISLTPSTALKRKKVGSSLKKKK